jgi:hypothetical protein
MVMTERYGVPPTKIIALMKYLQTRWNRFNRVTRYW